MSNVERPNATGCVSRLNAIKARLGAIPPSKLSALPKGVQTLISEDLPFLLAVATEAIPLHDIIEATAPINPEEGD